MGRKRNCVTTVQQQHPDFTLTPAMAWERGSCATTNKGAEESPVDSLSDEDLEDQVECTQQPDPAGEIIVEGLNFVRINADGALMISEDTFFVRFPIPNVQGIARGPGMNKIAPPEDSARGSYEQFTSGQHALFHSKGTGIYVSDCSSTGTVVIKANGQVRVVGQVPKDANRADIPNGMCVGPLEVGGHHRVWHGQQPPDVFGG